MMGWDEIFQPGLPKEAVVHSWRGQKSLFDAAKAGYDGVLSAGYYIDLLETAARHYAVDPLPANSGLTDAEAAHVLGGEATMWGEWVGPETIDSRVWPRAAAIAERFWSPREVNDVDDMYRRLENGERPARGSRAHARAQRRRAAAAPGWRPRRRRAAGAGERRRAGEGLHARRAAEVDDAGAADASGGCGEHGQSGRHAGAAADGWVAVGRAAVRGRPRALARDVHASGATVVRRSRR